MLIINNSENSIADISKEDVIGKNLNYYTTYSEQPPPTNINRSILPNKK